MSLPDWLKSYRRDDLAGDLIAGFVVAVMLIPQSLAYALMAGLPAQVGLYASVLPIMAYAAFGSSMSLAVGPVAVLSLMTASALHGLAPPGSAQYLALAAGLAALSGAMLLLFGLLRFGFLAHLLSHPVISGFISGSAVLILLGQLKPLLGLNLQGQGGLGLLLHLAQALPTADGATALIGLSSLLLLALARRHLAPLLRAFGLPSKPSDLLARLAPMLVVITAILVVRFWSLDGPGGVSVVGPVPAGLPGWPGQWPALAQWSELLLPAALLALVGFVESVSVAQSLALRKQQRIDPDRELLGLGAANLASALSGGYPVTGGFARSVVNDAAGARTPLAGVMAAVLMLVVVLFLTPWFRPLPHAVLAATIMIAVSSLIDVQTLRQAWHYDRADALSLIGTFLGVLLIGVEAGILIGVVLSLGALVWRSTRPHMAVVGRLAGSEHFRNIARHRVETLPGLIALRIDESLFFANASVVEARIESLLQAQPQTRIFLIIGSAINQIDATALAMLTELERSLGQRGILLWLAEIKGPVMDRLRGTGLGERLEGRVFLSTHEAFLAAQERLHARQDAPIGTTGDA